MHEKAQIRILYKHPQIIPNYKRQRGHGCISSISDISILFFVHLMKPTERKVSAGLEPNLWHNHWPEEAETTKPQNCCSPCITNSAILHKRTTLAGPAFCCCLPILVKHCKTGKKHKQIKQKRKREKEEVLSSPGGMNPNLHWAAVLSLSLSLAISRSLSRTQSFSLAQRGRAGSGGVTGWDNRPLALPPPIIQFRLVTPQWGPLTVEVPDTYTAGEVLSSWPLPFSQQVD